MKERRKVKLKELCMMVAELDFTGSIDYFPKLSFIKKDTSVDSKNDRNFYLWVLIHRAPMTDEDDECCDYIKDMLYKYDPDFYADLDEVIEDVKMKYDIE